MELRKLEEQYFWFVVKSNPIAATFLGIHEFDDKLPILTKRKIKKDIKKLKAFLKKFEKAKAKSFDEEIDKMLAIYDIKLALFGLEKLRFWEKDPDISFLGDALFPLIFKDFAPFEERIKNAIKRIEKFPKVLKQLKKLVKKPVKIWVKIAIENVKEVEKFLDQILELCEKKKIKEIGKARKAIKKARKALKDYEEHLKKISKKAKRKFWLNENDFDNLLKLRMINLSREEMLKIANNYLEIYKNQLKTILKKMKAKSIKEAEKKLEKDAPKSFEEVLKYHQKIVEELKRFLAAKKLFSLPKKEKLKIMETPNYLKTLIPYAAYFPPAPFEKEKLGIYIVTRSKELSKNFNYATIKNTAIHEAFPGHHLQSTYAALRKHYIRHLISPAEFVEGWAHYCEEYMLQKGFLKTAKEKFVYLKDAIWRACRVIVDIKLSTGKMSFNQAVNFLVKNAYLDRQGAIAEVKRYTKSPSYQLSYLIGKHLIKEMKEEFKEKLGKKFSEKKFNNLLMSEGNLPLHFFWLVMDKKLK